MTKIYEPTFKGSETGSQCWKNPLFSFAERLEMADGAVAYRDKIIARLREQVEGLEKLVTFDVHIATMHESHQTTYHVIVQRSDRPANCDLMDDTGRINVYYSTEREHAELTRDEWVDFLQGLHPVRNTSMMMDRIMVKKYRDQLQQAKQELLTYRDAVLAASGEIQVATASRTCLDNIAGILKVDFNNGHQAKTEEQA